MANLRAIAADGDADAEASASALALDMPLADPSFEWIWRAWHRLSDDRPRYVGGLSAPVPGRIPWSVVRLWSKHHGLQRGEMAMLDTCFMAMDAEYLKWWQEQQTTDAGTP